MPDPRRRNRGCSCTTKQEKYLSIELHAESMQQSSESSSESMPPLSARCRLTSIPREQLSVPRQRADTPYAPDRHSPRRQSCVQQSRMNPPEHVPHTQNPQRRNREPEVLPERFSLVFSCYGHHPCSRILQVIHRFAIIQVRSVHDLARSVSAGSYGQYSADIEKSEHLPGTEGRGISKPRLCGRGFAV